MKPSTIPFLAMVLLAGALVPCPFAAAQQGKEPELRAQIQQLEKRIAVLEEVVKALKAQIKDAPKTDAEDKLIGTWVVVEEDRKHAICSDLKLKADGTCDAAIRRDSSLNNEFRSYAGAKYTIVGKRIEVSKYTPTSPGLDNVFWPARIVSVSEKELVLVRDDGAGPKVRYTREK